MTKVVFIHHDEDGAMQKIDEFFDPAWTIIPLPPVVESVYPIIRSERPDVVVFSMAGDVDMTIKLAQLVVMANELKDARKFYLDFASPETKQELLDRMAGIGAVYMINYGILKEEVERFCGQT